MLNKENDNDINTEETYFEEEQVQEDEQLSELEEENWRNVDEPEEEPEKTPEEIREENESVLKGYVRRYLNAEAKKYDYDSIESAVSYVSSTDETYASEGQKFMKFRDDVWKAAYPLIEGILDNGEWLWYDQFVKQLPKLEL